ncbi:MAG: hydrogenase [Phycisphaerae bacterium]|nr:hydrogenase [Phycisphaerae bacterium]
MELFSDILVILLLLTNLRLLSSSRLASCVQTVAIQAVLLGALVLTGATARLTLEVIGLAMSAVMVKGLLLPWLLRRAIREAQVQREIEPIIGYTPSVLIGTVLLALCFVISAPLRQATPAGATLLIPGAMFTILTGLFIIVSRRKALTQVLGYLAMENGVYTFGTALAVEEPLLVEMGVLLDVLVAVFIMGITIFHINREFDHIDTDQLSVLKD